MSALQEFDLGRSYGGLKCRQCQLRGQRFDGMNFSNGSLAAIPTRDLPRLLARGVHGPDTPGQSAAGTSSGLAVTDTGTLPSTGAAIVSVLP